MEEATEIELVWSHWSQIVLVRKTSYIFLPLCHNFLVYEKLSELALPCLAGRNLYFTFSLAVPFGAQPLLIMLHSCFRAACLLALGLQHRLVFKL